MIILQAENISKMHSMTEGIKSASLKVSSSETIGIRGPSGSGKSTLLSVLSLIELPDSGSLMVFGRKYDFTPSRALRDPCLKSRSRQYERDLPIWPRLTVVFQELFLWPNLTLGSNISLAHDGRVEWRDEACRLLKVFDLEGSAGKYPHQCSLGQRQRAAIIRALSTFPEIVLLDEPTSALDAELSAAFIQEMALRNERGQANLIISHDRYVLAPLCERTYILGDGYLRQA